MKTTILGILTILVAVLNAALSFIKTGTCDFAATITAVTAGWGLVQAKDTPSTGDKLQIHPLAMISAIVLACVAMTSCVTYTAKDGTVTKRFDKETAMPVFDRVIDLFVPPKPAPLVIPAK